MALQIPINRISFNYANNEEYVFASNLSAMYMGPYYEIGGKTYAGKEYNANNPEIIKIIDVVPNPLKENPNTSEYYKLTNRTTYVPDIPSFFYVKGPIRYFLYQINTKLIKEISQEGYNSLRVLYYPLYKMIKLNYNERTGYNDAEVKEAEAIVPGITQFIKNLNFNPNNDIDTYMLGEG